MQVDENKQKYALFGTLEHLFSVHKILESADSYYGQNWIVHSLVMVQLISPAI